MDLFQIKHLLEEEQGEGEEEEEGRVFWRIVLIGGSDSVKTSPPCIWYRTKDEEQLPFFISNSGISDGSKFVISYKLKIKQFGLNTLNTRGMCYQIDPRAVDRLMPN